MVRRVIVLVALGLAVLGIGCAHSGAQTPEIKDEWVARVPPAQLQPVYQARQERRMAEDEVTRARVAVTDAENEVSIKNSLKEAADKRVEAALQAQEAARQTGDPNQIAQARSEFQQAQQRQALAQAEVNLAQEQREVALSRQQLAEARVTTQRVRAEQAKYQVLKQNEDTRVDDIDPRRFEQALTEAHRREREAQRKLQEQESKLASAEQQVKSAQQQLGMGGGGEQGQEP